MNDSITTFQQIQDKIRVITQERDWDQFHSPKNLSMAIAAEAAELMELFLWCSTQDSYTQASQEKNEVEQELADVFITAFLFAYQTKIDIVQAIEKKLAITAQKYPVHLAKGVSTKYNKLPKDSDK